MSVLLDSSLRVVAAHRNFIRGSLLGLISMRFLLKLRMLKSEDEEYKSRHLAFAPAFRSGTARSSVSFGILTGVDDLLDQFELDDVRRRETPVPMLGMIWGASRTSRTSQPAGE